jgi:hypothetical protein
MMAEQTPVPLDAFVTVVKLLYSHINDLAISVMVLRAALMQQSSLPVSAEELKRLHDYFRDYEPIRRAREAMESLEVNTSEDILELLKNFQGPIQ